jgi:hypothetical protein
MNRTLHVAAFLLVCSAPVSAGSDKAQTKTKVTPAAPRSERLAKALGEFNRGDPNDPYWEPCLSYYGAGAQEPAAANAGKPSGKKGRRPMPTPPGISQLRLPLKGQRTPTPGSSSVGPKTGLDLMLI